jgi:hypothetical protein
MEVAMLKSSRRIYRIPKAPFEPLNQTMDRGGYLVSQLEKTETLTPEEQERHVANSFQWLYEKQGMVYPNSQSHSPS